jgi:long-subunit fatty acid transport protein
MGWKVEILATLFSCCAGAQAMAAGIVLTAHSASGLGKAFAGAAALAKNPSTGGSIRLE